MRSWAKLILFTVVSFSLCSFGCGGGGGGSDGGNNNSSAEQTYSISGTVSVSGGGTLEGVIIKLSGTSSDTITTDASGNYSFSSLKNGSYTVTPSLTGYTFSQTSQVVTIIGADFPNINFTATQGSELTYDILGTVTKSTGDALSGVTMNLSGAGSGSTLTDGNGNYSFNNLQNGSYTVTPSLAGYTFSQTSQEVTINGAALPDINFTASENPNPTYSISGTVTDNNGVGLSGVFVSLSGAASSTTTTDAIGNFTLNNIANGSYTVTFAKSNYNINPNSVQITINNGNNTIQNDIIAQQTAMITFNKNFGGNNGDTAAVVLQTSDGGYILAGKTNSYGAGDADVWLIKTDMNGNKLWDKTFGGSNSDYVSDIVQTSDGGYILAGHSFSYGDVYEGDPWLIKTDANGNKLWDKTFGVEGLRDYFNAVRQTNDGGYILAGDTPGPGGCNAWLVKTDANGNELWNKSFGVYSYNWFGDVQQTSDGGYILAGLTDPNGAGYHNAWLVKTDVNGNKLWDKIFGGSDEDNAYAVQQTSDGGYIVTGANFSYETGDNVWLIKTDANGNKLWEKIFGGNVGGDDDDLSYYVQQTSDGGYILAGKTNSYGAGDTDAWLIKTDSNGNKVWDKTFGGSKNDGTIFVQQTNDGGYILVGYTNSYGAGDADVWLIKTDADGNAPSIPTP